MRQSVRSTRGGGIWGIFILTLAIGVYFVGELVAADTPPAGQSAAIRIKAGATTRMTDSAGNVWEPDRGFDGGETAERDKDLKIENTKDPALYRTEHWGMDSFSLPVPNGKYTVKLHFAETYEGVTEKGERVFSMDVEGHEIKDFDIFVKAGGRQKAYIETVPVEVKDGKLKIKFTQGEQSTEINGIEIISAP
jgi:hypothetical protein